MKLTVPLSILLLLPMSAEAWEPRVVNGKIVTWNKDSVDFYINTDNAPNLTTGEVEQAIIAAAAQWDASLYDANTAFSYAGSSKKNGADLSDGIHLVSFDTTWNQDPSLLAVTHVWSNSNDEIVHFDIEINADDVYWATTGDPNKYDLQNTMVHEFGHALGLEHSDEPLASMASSTMVGEVSKRDVHEDDIQGFVSLYPPSDTENPVGNEEETESTGSSSSGGGSVDNALIPTANGSGSGNMGPVSLDKAGCSTLANFDSLCLLLWTSIPLILRRSRP